MKENGALPGPTRFSKPDELPSVAAGAATGRVREAKWGQILMIRPGVAVEQPRTLAPGIDRAQYAEAVETWIRLIESTPVGKDLISEFDPTRNPKFRQITLTEGGSKELYAGVTVLIRPEIGSRSAIENSSLAGRKADGTPVGKASDTRIPFIKLPLPVEGTMLSQKDGIYVTRRGILNHPDFPKMTPFDSTLFHELIHAYYNQASITKDLLGNHKPTPDDSYRKGSLQSGITMGMVPDNVEEQLVVGILAGKGLYFSENTYRLQRGYEPRQSYKAVGIDYDKELDSYKWPADNHTDPAVVLIANGFTPQKGNWTIATPITH